MKRTIAATAAVSTKTVKESIYRGLVRLRLRREIACLFRELCSRLVFSEDSLPGAAWRIGRAACSQRNVFVLHSRSRHATGHHSPPRGITCGGCVRDALARARGVRLETVTTSIQRVNLALSGSSHPGGGRHRSLSTMRLHALRGGRRVRRKAAQVSEAEVDRCRRHRCHRTSARKLRSTRRRVSNRRSRSPGDAAPSWQRVGGAARRQARWQGDA